MKQRALGKLGNGLFGQGIKEEAKTNEVLVFGRQGIVPDNRNPTVLR